MDFLKLEKELKVLADKTRLNILQLIYQGDQCGCELIHALDIIQPTLSHHLNILSASGFIQGRRDKNKILYQVKLDKLKGLINDTIEAITYKKDCDL